MKYLFYLLVPVILLSTRAFAQNAELEKVRACFKNGKASEITQFLSEGVELNLLTNKQRYSAEDAELQLDAFFKEHPAIDFVFIHKGSSGQGLNYAIGDYTSTQSNMRVYVLLKQSTQGFMIDMIDVGN
jgi:hypothetical protein